MMCWGPKKGIASTGTPWYSDSPIPFVPAWLINSRIFEWPNKSFWGSHSRISTFLGIMRSDGIVSDLRRIMTGLCSFSKQQKSFFSCIGLRVAIIDPNEQRTNPLLALLAHSAISVSLIGCGGDAVSAVRISIWGNFGSINRYPVRISSW